VVEEAYTGFNYPVFYLASKLRDARAATYYNYPEKDEEPTIPVEDTMSVKEAPLS